MRAKRLVTAGLVTVGILLPPAAAYGTYESVEQSNAPAAHAGRAALRRTVEANGTDDAGAFSSAVLVGTIIALSEAGIFMGHKSEVPPEKPEAQ